VAAAEHDTIAEALAALERGEISSRELVSAALARAEARADLNAFITLSADRALALAEAADARRARGEIGLLDGVPIAHKDIFCTEGVATSCGSRMLAGFVPPYDAEVVERLAAAGAVVIGKTNMDEFAMGSSNETSYFGPARNPWRTDRVPGGSSGGSAAAVAAGIVPAATGTDTGGSIRQPAALCGLTGLKPTYGRCSRWGMVAFASSLDQAGPLAHSAEDAALMLQAMAGFDRRDSTSADIPVPDYREALRSPVRGLTVGLLSGPETDDLDPAIAAGLDAVRRTLNEAGVATRELRLERSRYAAPAYYVIAPAEASSNLARYDGVRYGYRCEAPRDLDDLYTRTRAEGFGREVIRRILTGTYALSVGYYDAYYKKAQQVRRLIRDELMAAFHQVDAILTPTTPTPAFPLGEKVDDPVTMYRQDVFTIPANLAGLPALSLPAGEAGGLPVGAQLIAPPFEEGRPLALAHRFQQATDYHLGRPAPAPEAPEAPEGRAR